MSTDAASSAQLSSVCSSVSWEPREVWHSQHTAARTSQSGSTSEKVPGLWLQSLAHLPEHRRLLATNAEP